MTNNTEIDDKLFDNIFRFVALSATCEEYYFHIADGLIKMDLELVKKEYESKNYHPKQVRKIVDRREKELNRIHASRQKFFTDFVKRFNVPPYSKLTDNYVELLHTALNSISYKDANNPETPATNS